MKNIKIKFATSKDFEKIRKFDPHSKYIDPKRIMLKIKGKEIIIALNKETIVGIIRISYIWSTRPYLELIFVNEKSRKTGLGRGLLDFLEDYLIGEGCSYLVSSTEEGEPSQKWHTKMGFKEAGKLKGMNLPHNKVAEIFYLKKISDNKEIKKYPLMSTRK